MTKCEECKRDLTELQFDSLRKISCEGCLKAAFSIPPSKEKIAEVVKHICNLKLDEV